MKISVTAPAYNSPASVGDTLASVASQPYSDTWHLVIDGGSRDGTRDLVRTLGCRVARFVSEPNRGIYDAMIKGLAPATHEVAAS